MKRLVVAVSFVSLGLSAAASVPSVVPAGDVARAAASDLAGASALVDGELRVTAGEAATTVPLANVDGQGALVVPSGAVTFTPAESVTYATPSETLAQAALWVDASDAASVRLQSDDALAGRVSRWLDCREPDKTLTADSTAYSYVRLVAQTNVKTHASADVATWFPSYVAAADGANAYLDFGGYGSGQNLRCVAADGKETTVGNVCRAFVVYGTEDYKWGFLFNEANATYVPQYYNHTSFSASTYYCHLNGGDNQKRVTSGFRCDRKTINPMTTKLTAGYHLVDFPVLLGDFTVKGFFDDRGNEGRQGGGRLCEVLLFTNDLTAAACAAVESYLYRKWIDRTPQASIVAGPAAAVAIDVAEGVVAPVGNAGVGTVAKTGAGTLAGAALDGTEATAPLAVRLDAGALAVSRAVTLVEAAPATYAASTGQVVRTAAAAAGTLTKTGEEELSVTTLSDDVTAIDVQAGVLRLAAAGRTAADGLPSSLVGAIEDPSFEAFADQTVDVNDQTPSLTATTAVHGWKATAGSNKPFVVQRNESGNKYYTKVGVPYPDGDYAMVLHLDAGCETTVTLPAAGVYRLSFAAAARPGYKGGEFRVSVDGTPVAQVQTQAETYRTFAFRLPSLAAGEHTLTFQGDAKNNKNNSGLSGNKVCMFDDVRVDWLAADEPGATVSNGGFEVCEFQSFNPVSTNAATGWTDWAVTVSDGASGAYLVSADSPAIALGGSSVAIPEIPEGGRALILCGTPTLTGKATFAQAGTYTLSLVLGGWFEANKVTALPTVRVTVGDGLLDATATVAAGLRQPQTVTLGTVTVTESQVGVAQTLTVAGAMAGAVAFLDDIRFTPGVRVVNGFASDGWSIVQPESDVQDGSGKICWLTADDVSWGATRYGDDAVRVGIRNRGAIHRTERLAAGTYRLSVASIGRFYRYGGLSEDLAQRFSDNSFEAWFGTTDGAVTNVIGRFGVGHAERWQQHSFLFTVPETGDWRIGFRGLRESDKSYDGVNVQSHGGILDGLVIEPAARGEDAALAKGLAIRVAAGAKLFLDAPTTNAVSEVRLGGRRRHGVVSAETFPEYVTGPGALLPADRGAVVVIR